MLPEKSGDWEGTDQQRDDGETCRLHVIVQTHRGAGLVVERSAPSLTNVLPEKTGGEQETVFPEPELQQHCRELIRRLIDVRKHGAGC